MPGVEKVKSSWADEVELDYGGLVGFAHQFPMIFQ